MGARGPGLARLRRSLAKHAADGWARAVFARPGDDADVREHPGPTGRPSPQEVEALVDAATAAAKEGRVKQTLVLDDRRRVRIDARHGRAKVQVLDEVRARKMMGGKERALRPDDSAPLLRAIGLMNADGTISAKHAKKYKQVNHFVELCRPIWGRLADSVQGRALRVLDLGCGNAYLTFVLAEALRLEGIDAQLHGIDVREDVVERARTRASALGWAHVTFETGAIASAPRTTADLVVALHACDTATDEALTLAIETGASAILCAPCCQRQLAAELERDGVPLAAIARHGLLGRDYAAVLTDALRVEILGACGYDVDTLEFVASEHTPKNLLIRAVAREPGRPLAPSRWKLADLAAHCTTQNLPHPPLLIALLSLPRED